MRTMRLIFSRWSDTYIGVVDLIERDVGAGLYLMWLNRFEGLECGEVK